MEILSDLKCPGIKYPVGTYIEANLPMIQQMSEAIYTVLHREFENTKVDILCMGSSGAIIAAFVAKYLIDKKYNARVYHIKKEGEFSHNTGEMIRDYAIQIIVDDFISSGETICSIIEKSGVETVSLLCVSGGCENYNKKCKTWAGKIIFGLGK